MYAVFIYFRSPEIRAFKLNWPSVLFRVVCAVAVDLGGFWVQVLKQMELI